MDDFGLLIRGELACLLFLHLHTRIPRYIS
jgi:hypothetical protein